MLVGVCFFSSSLQKDNEKNHKVRIAIGNGVRTDIWTEFLNRFGNIKVRELYAATEGNIGFVNYTSKVGTVGRVNPVHRVSPQSPRELRVVGCGIFSPPFSILSNCDIWTFFS